MRRIVNGRTNVRRKFLGSGALPGVKNQKEFAQGTERGFVERVFLSKWSYWGKGFEFLGGRFRLEKGWHGRASL
jgi:hypothetical protein